LLVEQIAAGTGTGSGSGIRSGILNRNGIRNGILNRSRDRNGIRNGSLNRNRNWDRGGTWKCFRAKHGSRKRLLSRFMKIRTSGEGVCFAVA
jgi:hypothetical protein